MEKPIRIVLANHHPIIRSDLRLLLERQPAFHVTGEAANGSEAVILAEYRRPDVVLLDVKLPQLSGIAAAREIASKKPGIGIIFITALMDREYVSQAFKAGARGYVFGDNAQGDLFWAVQVVARGGSFLSPSISERLIDEYSTRSSNDSDISGYQRQLCCMLAAGYEEQEIAIRLKSTASRIRDDCQNLSHTLQQLGVPQLILDLIYRNQRMSQPMAES